MDTYNGRDWRDSQVPITPCPIQPGDQVYTFTDGDGWIYQWNATRGRQIAEASHASDLLAFVPEEHGITMAHVRSRYPDMDEAYARTTDLRLPLLFIPHRAATSGNHLSATALLIDGWHRLMKALLTGVPELPAYILTKAKAASILIRKTPPQP